MVLSNFPKMHLLLSQQIPVTLWDVETNHPSVKGKSSASFAVLQCDRHFCSYLAANRHLHEQVQKTPNLKG